ncbi:MAG TPA: hypothetical protein VK638_33705, partial [Edaphobacter sp.]|nr:hypothetical protein [Edaphobacter sp.]
LAFFTSSECLQVQSRIDDAISSSSVLRRGLGRLSNSRTTAALLDQVLVGSANFGTNILLGLCCKVLVAA